MDTNERVNLVVGERKSLPFDISEAGPGMHKEKINWKIILSSVWIFKKIILEI